MDDDWEILVGGAITILKNDGVRQWDGLSHIFCDYWLGVDLPSEK
jgi:hypothetical protein